MGGALIAGIYIVVTIACVGMATMSTYFGYVTLLKYMALPFAVVVALGLVACDIKILMQRRDGKSVFWTVAMLLLLTALSAGSNFNYFYTNFMREGVVSERLQMAQQNFDANVRTALTAVDGETKPFRDQKAAIERLLVTLTNEVTDPRNEGWGTRALGYLKEITDLLDQLKQPIQGGRPPASRSKPQENLAFLERIKGQVNSAVAAAEKTDPFIAVSRRIETARADQLQSISKLNVSSPLELVSYQDKINAIKAFEAVAIAIERDVRDTFNRQRKPVTIQMRPTRHEGIELDTIPNTLRMALVERPNDLAALMAAALAVLIDIIPLLFALAFIQKISDEDEPDTGRDKVTTGRKPGILRPRSSAR